MFSRNFASSLTSRMCMRYLPFEIDMTEEQGTAIFHAVPPEIMNIGFLFQPRMASYLARFSIFFCIPAFPRRLRPVLPEVLSCISPVSSPPTSGHSQTLSILKRILKFRSDIDQQSIQILKSRTYLLPIAGNFAPGISVPTHMSV